MFFLENFKTNSSSGAVLWVLTIFFIQDRDGSSLLCMVLHRLVHKIQIQLQVKNETQLFEKCFFYYCRWDNGKMNIPHRILTPDDPDTGIPGKYTEVNTSNECVTTPQSSYGDVSTWQPLRQAFLESLYRI